MFRGRHPGFQLGRHQVGEFRGVRDQDGRGHRVVLGLGDQVGGHVGGIRGGVRDDGDLGGSGLGVDAHDSPQQPFRSHHVDVPGAGDHGDGCAETSHPVGEHRDCLGPADGVDLLDPEHVAQRKDVRVRPAAETGLRRGRHGDFPDPRHLGGNDVHDHTGGQWGEPARNVEADPFDGDVAQPHPGTLGQDRGGGIGIAFQGFCDQAATPDGLLEGLPEFRVELPGGPGQHPLRHPEGPGNHAVEALRVLCERLGSPVTDRVAHPPHRFHGSRDVQRRPGNVGAVVALEAGQVNRSKHGRSVYRRDPPGFRRRCWNGGRRFGPEGGEQHDGGDRAERSH